MSYIFFELYGHLWILLACNLKNLILIFIATNLSSIQVKLLRYFCSHLLIKSCFFLFLLTIVNSVIFLFPVFREVSVRCCSSMQPSQQQLWGSRLLQDQGQISNLRKGQGQEIIKLWGGSRQRHYFNMSLLTSSSCSFRKVTKGDSSYHILIYMSFWTHGSCLTTKQEGLL